MNRYVLARAKGIQQYEAAVDEDVLLLKRYGVRLLAIPGGICVALEANLRGDQVHSWDRREMNAETWEWVRPLLVRLRDAENALSSCQAGRVVDEVLLQRCRESQEREAAKPPTGKAKKRTQPEA